MHGWGWTPEKERLLGAAGVFCTVPSGPLRCAKPENPPQDRGIFRTRNQEEAVRFVTDSQDGIQRSKQPLLVDLLRRHWPSSASFEIPQLITARLIGADRSY